MKTHEKSVEDFYSFGFERDNYDSHMLKNRDGGFLSFGLWKKGGREPYLEAANNLLAFFIQNSGVKNADKILNVACGNGSETFAYYNAFKPKQIIGMDITKVHTDYANKKAKKLKLDKNIKFHHGDACVLDFPEESFSHILGIEGIAHFNTRENFFKASNKVLKRKGEMILTDIILGDRFDERKKLFKLITKFTAKTWVIPRANWTNEKQYRKQLEKAGFKVEFIKKIGKNVFPGYAKNGLTYNMFKSRAALRGFFPALGLTFISTLLGYLQNKNFIEYIYVKAVKQ